MAVAEAPRWGAGEFLLNQGRRVLRRGRQSSNPQPQEQAPSATQDLSERAARTQVSIKDRFSTFITAQENYYLDRPEIQENNRSIAKILQLLADEITECSAPIEKGRIETFSPQEYRQQELSDVFIFSLCLLQQFPASRQPELRELPTSFQTYSERHLPTTLRYQAGKAWSKTQERFFQQSLQELEWLQRHVLHLQLQLPIQASIRDLDRFDQSDIWRTSSRIMELAWMLLEMCVSDPVQALMEKTARNIIKYPSRLKVHDPQTHSYKLFEGSDYLAYRGASRDEFKKTFGNQKFYDLPYPAAKPKEPEKAQENSSLSSLVLQIPSIPLGYFVMLR